MGLYPYNAEDNPVILILVRTSSLVYRKRFRIWAPEFGPSRDNRPPPPWNMQEIQTLEYTRARARSFRHSSTRSISSYFTDEFRSDETRSPPPPTTGKEPRSRDKGETDQAARAQINAFRGPQRVWVLYTYLRSLIVMTWSLQGYALTWGGLKILHSLCPKPVLSICDWEAFHY